MAPIFFSKEGICLFVRTDEHLPPHIHAEYGDDKAMIDIRTGELLRGEFKNKKLKIVQHWLGQGNNRKWIEEKFYALNPELRPGKRFRSDDKK